MDKIIIEGTLEEALTADDYDTLYDTLMQLGIENIRIETFEKDRSSDGTM